VYLIAFGIGAGAGLDPATASILANLFGLGGSIVFIFRDVLFGGAGPGKRLVGLRVVTQRDGVTALGPGPAGLRWVRLAIPFFNLVDLSVPFRDPLQRRYGDRWAGTRVIDTPGKLEKARAQAQALLAKKGVELAPVPMMTMEQFARIGG